VESGTRRWRSALKRLGRGDKKKGTRLSAVEMAGGVAPFYRVREAGR
jgi:hypothetical protein